MTYEQKCVQQVEAIAKYYTWEDVCREKWENDNEGMEFFDYLEEAQTNLDYLQAQDNTLEGIVRSSREIVKNGRL